MTFRYGSVEWEVSHVVAVDYGHVVGAMPDDAAPVNDQEYRQLELEHQRLVAENARLRALPVAPGYDHLAFAMFRAERDVEIDRHAECRPERYFVVATTMWARAGRDVRGAYYDRAAKLLDMVDEQRRMDLDWDVRDRVHRDDAAAGVEPIKLTGLTPFTINQTK